MNNFLVDPLTIERGSEMPCKCLNCSKTYYINKSVMSRVIKGTKTSKCCSVACSNQLRQRNLKRESVICQQCGKEFKDRPHEKRKFCSRSCSVTYNNLKKPKSTSTFQCVGCDETIISKRSDKRKYCSIKCQKVYQRKILIDKWKRGIDKGHVGETYQLRNCVRNYLLQKYNHSCSKCGWSEKHPVTGNIPVQIHHIDGDPSNCTEQNLIALCPNCHSLTSNYGALNPNSCRNRKPALRENRTPIS